jgi:hypothetical protein
VIPRQPVILWVYTSLLILGFLIANIIYYDRLLASGTLSPDADSVAIPMFDGIMLTVFCAPFVMAITWLCLRHYNAGTKLLAWRVDRPVRSFAATLACMTMAVALIVATINDFRKALPSYEYILTYYSLLWIPWLLWLRAAVIEQMPRRLN